MNIQTNQSLSVDCVVFGFNGQTLKVLLIKQQNLKDTTYKLPGSMILEDETLPCAAIRVLEEMTALRNVYLRQTTIFSDPNRLTPRELNWINEYHKIATKRVVTVGYYALVKLDEKIIKHTTSKGAHWAVVDSIKHLAMDHKLILADALDVLCNELISSPIAFELLPRKFTIRELQTLYSAILGVEIDNRNFRKKVLTCQFLIPTGEKEKAVAHKPAQYYTFNKTAYNKTRINKFKLGFL
ncbi:MAG: NUDIX hydrolase [Rikenellaceae bacterium]